MRSHILSSSAAVQSAVVSVANAHDVEEESRLIADIQLVDDAFSVSQLDVREQLEEKDTEISVCSGYRL
jgi:hypothetical protein